VLTAIGDAFNLGPVGARADHRPSRILEILR
jgi:hypothetical protein